MSKTTSQASDFTCPAVEGHYPDPEACNIYHQCAGGVAHATTCQPGLAWNVVINMCDWEANVDCDINRFVTGEVLVFEQDEVFKAPSVLPSKVRELSERPKKDLKKT